MWQRWSRGPALGVADVACSGPPLPPEASPSPPAGDCLKTKHIGRRDVPKQLTVTCAGAATPPPSTWFHSSRRCLYPSLGEAHELRPLPPRGFTPPAGACTPPPSTCGRGFICFAGAMMPPSSRPRAQAAHAAWASSASADGGTVAAGPT